MKLNPTVVRTAGTSASLHRDVMWAGVAFLLVTKLLDVITTVVGLSFFPSLIERNPVAEHLIAHLGLVPGLFTGGMLAVAGIVVYVEAGNSVVTYFEPEQCWPSLLARTAGYVPPSLFFAMLAINNAFLIGRAVAA